MTPISGLAPGTSISPLVWTRPTKRARDEGIAGGNSASASSAHNEGGAAAPVMLSCVGGGALRRSPRSQLLAGNVILRRQSGERPGGDDNLPAPHVWHATVGCVVVLVSIDDR